MFGSEFIGFIFLAYVLSGLFGKIAQKLNNVLSSLSTIASNFLFNYASYLGIFSGAFTILP
jgi:hypothetical protein